MDARTDLSPSISVLPSQYHTTAVNKNLIKKSSGRNRVTFEHSNVLSENRGEFARNVYSLFSSDFI